MDINFIIFFVFLIVILEYISTMNDGMMLIVFGFFMAAIFANTQSSSPLFFSNTDYLGWGQLFNTFWLVLVIVCIVRSIYLAKNNGLIGAK